jgi:putative SOS response-associated peptidase YedK
MCNSYVIRPKRGALGLAQRVSEATARLASELVRKSDPGVVLRADGRVEIMRWGFHRELNPAINNARSDKLEGSMWNEAFHERRCVIPMTLFYEWGPGVGGCKQANEFRDPDDDFLWAAGLWEEHPEFGASYSMITTAASPLMAPIHNRMPALLRPEEMDEWLAGKGGWNFLPFTGPLATTLTVVLPKVRTCSNHQRSRVTNRMTSCFMTCMATYGNGARTGLPIMNRPRL